MNKKTLILNLECIGIQILASVFSLVFYNNIIPAKWFSLFTAWLFIWALNSTFWQLGNKDRKMYKIMNNHRKECEGYLKQNRFKGAFLALPFLIFNVFVLTLTYYINNDIMITIQSILNFPFSGFLPVFGDVLDSKYYISRLIVCFVMYVPCVTAYFSGSYNFSITEILLPKLIYKSQSNDKSKTNK